MKDGKLAATRGIFRDVTERKKAEKELMSRTTERERLNKLMVGRELKMVEQSLVKSLGAIHHSRVKYPQADEQKSPAA